MVKIKVPQEIKLLTHTIKIRFDVKQVISQGTCGITRHLFQDIMLDNLTLPTSELNQVFLHEYIHVIERHFALKLDDNDVERLAEGLSVLLFDSLNIELDWVDIKEG